MISAKEAKELYDQSGVEADQLLATFEPKIVDAAKSGKRTVFILVGSVDAFTRVELTPVQSQAIDKLLALGYRVQFAKHGESYVPRGLADDDGKGPLHTNFGFCIHW